MKHFQPHELKELLAKFGSTTIHPINYRATEDLGNVANKLESLFWAINTECDELRKEVAELKYRIEELEQGTGPNPHLNVDLE